ncbi:aminopeptidase P family N-terminal domain-containing protein [Halobacillus andaensis]|uniref:aminopeptidase P family N-terminal domain-containing protein n=1 Tax=Halobacillus andaensis TaxID=1176239 RepID=UPI003D72C16E
MQIDKLRSLMDELGYDGVLLRKRNNFSWVTGGRYNHIVQATEAGVADLLITNNKIYLITSKMEERRIYEEECEDLPWEIEVLSDDWYRDTDLLIIQAAGNKKDGK